MEGNSKWRRSCNLFPECKKGGKCHDFCAASGCGRQGSIILLQPAHVPLGEPLHTGSSVQHRDKSTFLPCQDVVRVKKYIKDSWMVSYYGNAATWLCRGALRPYLPCLHSSLHIHAPEICPLACAQLWKVRLLRPISAPPSTFSVPVVVPWGQRRGTSLGDIGGGWQGTVPWMFPTWRWDGIYRQPKLRSWETWEYTKVWATPKSRSFRTVFMIREGS